MILPAATVGLAWVLWRSLAAVKSRSGRDWHSFAAAAGIFVLAFLGLAYSIYPYVVIDRLTLWEAAAHPTALRFILVGAIIVLPFIVFYTLLSYRIFRGKAKAGLYD